jgi:Ca2+-transporting ATPase
METLQVIGEGDEQPSYRRMWSTGTWSTAVGDDVANKRGRSLSVATTADTAAEESRSGSGKKSRKERKEEAAKAKEEAKKPQTAHLDPEKDTTDPTPFREKPSRLAMLVDPKSVDDLEKIGGVQGMLEGLGVDPKMGLGDETHQGEGAPRSGREVGNGPQFQAGLEKRRTVYGRNDLPERPSKTLLQLMWIAFKDKVLVSAAILLSCDPPPLTCR